MFFNTGTSTGDVTVNLRSGFQGPIIYGADPNPVINPANGHRYYLLESGMPWTDAEACAVAQWVAAGAPGPVAPVPAAEAP